MTRWSAIVTAMALLLAGFAVPHPAAGAEAQPPAATGQAEGSFEIKKETYEYTSTELRDPFLSLIQAAKKKAKDKPEVPKTPPEEYDLSQMKLVAVASDARQSYALVGLPDGKYYLLVEGMPAGIHEGKVLRITEDSMIVREYIPDFKGRMQPQDSELRLRPKEEE